MKTNLVMLGCAEVVMTAPARAAVLLLDVSADPAGWQAALQATGHRVQHTTDFGLDPDYGVIGFIGPLTAEGAGPVSPGIVAEGFTMAMSYAAPEPAAGLLLLLGLGGLTGLHRRR